MSGTNKNRNEYLKRYRKNNPDYERRKQYKRRYRLSIEDISKMLEKQNYQCAICGKSFDMSKPPRIRFNIDHNHKTGKVRGILCLFCNFALGFYEGTHFQKFDDYLKKWENQ
jgi:DNA-directed RNA polymerase subunit RPC12/RpoP